jgi:hypothetical protein
MGSQLAFRPLRVTGLHLGNIVVAARVAVKRVHGPGGALEGYPVDWTQALCIACWHANQYMAERQQHGEPNG